MTLFVYDVTMLILQIEIRNFATNKEKKLEKVLNIIHNSVIFYLINNHPNQPQTCP